MKPYSQIQEHLSFCGMREEACDTFSNRQGSLYRELVEVSVKSGMLSADCLMHESHPSIRRKFHHTSNHKIQERLILL